MKPSPEDSQRFLQERPYDSSVSTIDYALLNNAIIELNISRKNLLLYPEGHEQCLYSLERSYTTLSKFIHACPDAKLGFARDRLMINDEPLDKENPVYREFSLAASRQQIAAVAFTPSLTQNELMKFLHLLNAGGEQLGADFSPARAAEESGIHNIHIYDIDYQSFKFTEHDAEPHKKSGLSTEERDNKLWQAFVSQIGKPDGGSIDETDGVAHRQISPEDLAFFLNAGKVDSADAISSYDRVISGYVQHRMEYRSMQDQTLKKMNELVDNLNPELRRQFLYTAFNSINQTAAAGTSEKSASHLTQVLQSFSSTSILEMLQKANEEHREISPTLIRLVQKMSGVSDNDAICRNGADSSGEHPGLSAQHIENLFNREKYETYVDSEYDSTLRKISTAAPVSINNTELSPDSGSDSLRQKPSFDLDQYSETLQESNMDVNICRLTISYMDQDIDIDDYRDFSHKLLHFVPNLIDLGKFDVLRDVVNTIKKHAVSKQETDITRCAKDCLYNLKQPSLVTKAVSSFAGIEETTRQDAYDFFISVGRDCIPGIMDIYLNAQDKQKKTDAGRLLKRFGEAAGKEALKRLSTEPPDVFPRITSFVRAIRYAEALPAVRQLAEHESPAVQIDALATLLWFKDSAALPLLTAMLKCKDTETCMNGVHLAGHYRVAESVPELCRLLKMTILRKADIDFDMEIINALGSIGDPAALPYLEKLSKKQPALHRSAMQELKLTVFRSLSGYPAKEIQSLVTAGIESSDTKIRLTCEKLKVDKRCS